MNAIIGFTEILLATDPRPEQLARLEVIERHADHLLEIVHDVLDLSKIEEGHVDLQLGSVEVVGMLQDVQHLHSLAARQKAISLNVQLRGILPRAIRTDPTRLRQVLVNLVSNAVKFTEAGHVDLGAAIEGDSIVFEVRDSGIGISEEALERIFDEYEQADTSTPRQFGGTGLGLAISRQLTRLMGGDLTVTSAPGVGSTFRVELPLEVVEPGASDPDVCGGWSVAGRRVLVAEDGPDNQRLLEFYLRQMALDVHTADHGRQAVDAVLSAQAAGRPFDLVIMDIQMPHLDGVAATKLLRERGITVPIVALTANATVTDRARCLDAGCSDFVAKPIRGPRLREVVATWVRPA